MSKIESLTPKQQEKVGEYFQRYLKIGLGTNQNPDVKLVEASITKMYSFIGKAAPEFVWCASPKDATTKIMSFDPKADVSCDFWGSQDMYWVCFYQYASQVLNVDYGKKNQDILDIYEALGKNVGWWYAFENYCFISRLPTKLRINNRNVLHSFDFPAMEFSDGFSVYSMNGVKVPEYYVKTKKEDINVKKLLKEPNSEIKMAVIGKIGVNNLLDKLGGREIDRVNLSNDKTEKLVEVAIDGNKIRYLIVSWEDKFSHKTTSLSAPVRLEDFHQRWQDLYGENWGGNPDSAKDVAFWMYGIPIGTEIHQHT